MPRVAFSLDNISIIFDFEFSKRETITKRENSYVNPFLKNIFMIFGQTSNIVMTSLEKRINRELTFILK